MKTKDKLLIAGLTGTGLLLGSRFLMGQLAKWVGKILMTDVYDKNLLELVSASRRVGIQNVWETNLRAEQGKVINRPFGSPKKFIDFSGLSFSPVYLKSMPTPESKEVKMNTVIGKGCKKPLNLSTPIIVSGMAYGLGLSKQTKYALAKGTAMAGTATNTGEGPLLHFERKLAKNVIIQYNRGKWTKEPEVLAQADMIEIQLGQGAKAGVGHRVESKNISLEMRKIFQLKSGEDAVIAARQPALADIDGLPKLVTRLKELTGGVPIGIKLSFNNTIEQDIDIAIDAGVDVLALEGAQSATKGSPPILQDDFGLPTLVGLCRVVKHLKNLGLHNKLDLIVSGGLVTPGDFLKVLALGANAVYIGSIALFAMTHTQTLKVLPYEPPTQIAWQTGKKKDSFNWKLGAQSLARFINSCTLEMAEGIRALGKTTVDEIDISDLIALDETTSAVTGIPVAWTIREETLTQ